MKNKVLSFLGKISHKVACLLLLIEAKLIIRKDRLQGFTEHTMDPSFDYKKYRRKISPYFKKWGFKYSMVEAEYYQRMNGVEADYYIPFTFLGNYLRPYLNGDGKYIDKNTFRMVLDVNNPNKKIPFKMAEQVIWKREGILYNSSNECCTIDEAVAAVMAYDKDIIIKPTKSTTWGRGVIKLKVIEKTPEKVKQLIIKYRNNFSFEECVIQHSDISTLNASSLNTTRIVTYRRPNGEIKCLFFLQRFGCDGEVVDNASAGGNFVAVHEDGTLDRVIKSYGTMKTRLLDDKCLKKIPFFDRMKDVAIYLHGKLPDVNLVGWDFSITQDGTPVVIELNYRPSVSATQILTGPAFSKEDLDELMPLIAQWKVSYIAKPMVRFKKGGKSAHLRYI